MAITALARLSHGLSHRRWGPGIRVYAGSLRNPDPVPLSSFGREDTPEAADTKRNASLPYASGRRRRTVNDPLKMLDAPRSRIPTKLISRPLKTAPPSGRIQGLSRSSRVCYEPEYIHEQRSSYHHY